METPDSARATFDSSVNTAASVVAKQKAMMKASNARNAKDQADDAAATTAKKNGVVASRMNQVRNGVKKSRDSIGWRLVWPVNNYNYSLAQHDHDEGDAPAAKDAPKTDAAPAKDAAPTKEAAPAKEGSGNAKKEEEKADPTKVTGAPADTQAGPR